MDWKRTLDLCGAPFTADAVDDQEEDLTLGFSLLRALAKADHSIVEIGDGVWRHSAEGVTYVSKDELL